MDSYNPAHYRQDMQVMHDYLFTKHNICVKADGRIAKYSKFAAFFERLFSWLTGTSFNRDDIKIKLTQLKNSLSLQQTKEGLEKETANQSSNNAKFYEKVDFDVATVHIDQLIGTGEQEIVGLKKQELAIGDNHITGKVILISKLIMKKHIGRIANGDNI